MNKQAVLSKYFLPRPIAKINNNNISSPNKNNSQLNENKSDFTNNECENNTPSPPAKKIKINEGENNTNNKDINPLNLMELKVETKRLVIEPGN